MMILGNALVLFEYVLAIRCDIKPESVQECRNITFVCVKLRTLLNV
jgi:hypothetical protein